MSRRINNENLKSVGKYFNDTFKRVYLSTIYNFESTFNNTSIIFKKAYNIEHDLKKDIYDFNLDEIYELLRTLSNKSEPTLRTYLTQINKYLNYCVGEEKIKFNIISGIKAKDLIEKSGADVEPAFLTRRIVYEELLPKLINAQDKAYVVLLFENILWGYEELSNLKISDIDKIKKTIVVRRNDDIKNKKISDEILNYILEAAYQKDYCPNALENEKRKNNSYNLELSEYVFKRRYRKSASEKLEKGSFDQRNNTLKAYLIEQYNESELAECLSETTLAYSGLYEKLLNLKRELTDSDYKAVLRDYSPIKDTSSNKLKGDFEKLYFNQTFRADYEELLKFRNEVPEITDEQFVKEKTVIGLWGENFILKYLNDELGVNENNEFNAKKVEAWNGYDLELYKRVGIEVKTTASSTFKKFNVSLTELKKANLMRDLYFFFLVMKDDRDEKHVKIIKNPIQTLHIDMNFINNVYGSKETLCSIKSTNFEINLNNENIVYMTMNEFIAEQIKN